MRFCVSQRTEGDDQNRSKSSTVKSDLWRFSLSLVGPACSSLLRPTLGINGAGKDLNKKIILAKGKLISGLPLAHLIERTE